MSMKKLLDEAVKASAVADATVAAVSQLADMADERSEEAADALDALRDYIERAAKTAEEVVRDNVTRHCCGAVLSPRGDQFTFTREGLLAYTRDAVAAGIAQS